MQRDTIFTDVLIAIQKALQTAHHKMKDMTEQQNIVISVSLQALKTKII